MEWSKVKSVLIVMLIFVNGFLIFAYASTAWREGQNREQLRKDTYAALMRLGVTISESLIPEQASGLRMYRASANAAADEASMRDLLGECTVENSGGGRRVYHGEHGTAALRGGWITLELDSSIRTEAEARAFVDATLKTLGEETTRTELISPEPDCVIETVGALDGVPIFNARLRFAFREDGVTVTGTRLLPTMEAASGRVREVSDLLLVLATDWDARGEANRTILGITPGYLSENTPNGDVSLTPGWEVESDRGVWYVNAQTGSVIAPS